MTWSFHCDQRPLFTKEPSFSIQWVVGSMKTSVWIDAESTFGAFQNSELAVGSGSITTSRLSLPRAVIPWFESGPMAVAVLPERLTPPPFPLRAWSSRELHAESPAGFGCG